MTEFDLDELDRILGDEPELQPMTGFSTRVLRAVHDDAATKPPLAFPWSRFLPGLVLSLSLLVAAALWTIPTADSWGPTAAVLAEWIADSQTRGLLWAAATLLGSFGLAWATSRAATSRHVASF